MITCDRVLIDDCLAYSAIAVEWGEDGEVVDVHTPAVPADLWAQLGMGISLRLEYVGHEHSSGFYVLQNIIEFLESGNYLMQFTKMEMYELKIGD